MINMISQIEFAHSRGRAVLYICRMFCIIMHFANARDDCEYNLNQSNDQRPILFYQFKGDAKESDIDKFENYI